MGRNDHFIMPQTQQAKLILHNMKTDFIYLKGILKKTQLFWHQLLRNKQNTLWQKKSKSIKAIPGRSG